MLMLTMNYIFLPSLFKVPRQMFPNLRFLHLLAYSFYIGKLWKIHITARNSGNYTIAVKMLLFAEKGVGGDYFVLRQVCLPYDIFVAFPGRTARISPGLVL